MQRSALAALALGIASLTAFGDEATLTPDQMRADLVFLRDQWGPKEKSFDDAARAAFGKVIEEAQARVDTFTPADFSLEVSRAVAVSRNGHTVADFHTNILPVRVWWFSDGLYVVKAAPEYKALVGAKVVSFGSTTAEETLAKLKPFVSGTDEFIRYQGLFVIVSPNALHHVGVIPASTRVPMTLRLRSGEQRTVELDPQSKPNPDPGAPWTALVPSKPDLEGRWSQVLDDVSWRSPGLQRPVDVSTDWIGPKRSVLYIRSTQVISTDDKSLADKFTAVLNDVVVAKRPHDVIVDLRFNSGGDLLQTALFAHALPRLLPQDGKLLVLTGNGTFSAGIVLAAMLKAESGGRAQFIGEKMGDKDHFWAEGGNMELPNSHVNVHYTDGYHDWAKGCPDLDKCYWAVVALHSRTISLEPDVRVDMSFSDYAAGRDPVLAAALSRIP